MSDALVLEKIKSDIFNNTLLSIKPKHREQAIKILKRWVADLRSGKFEQGKAYLKKNEQYCCLGVFGVGNQKSDVEVLKVFEGFGKLFTIPSKYFRSNFKEVMPKYLELNETLFIRLNDIHNLTFNQIADVIEESITFLSNSQKIGVVGFLGQSFNEEKAKGILLSALGPYTGLGSQCVIVSGLTKLGIPKLAYEFAVNNCLLTQSICCEEGLDFETFDVDDFIITGEEFGDESEEFLSHIDRLVRVGGGKQSKAEIKRAKELGIPVEEYNL